MQSSPQPGSDEDAARTSISLGATSQVPVGSGVIFPGQKVVVTQPTAGTYKAFSALCTHIGCLMDLVSDSQIVCRCNGSRFSITDGAVQSGPAAMPLPGVVLTVQDSELLIRDGYAP